MAGSILPFVHEIGLTFNSTGKFNLNPFVPKNLNYRAVALGNIDIDGNFLTASADVSDGILSNIMGSGKVSVLINPEVYAWLPVR